MKTTAQRREHHVVRSINQVKWFLRRGDVRNGNALVRMFGWRTASLGLVTTTVANPGRTAIIPAQTYAVQPQWQHGPQKPGPNVATEGLMIKVPSAHRQIVVKNTSTTM